MAASVFRSTSQPVSRAPSQSAKPSSQEPMVQEPKQDAKAWAKAQVVPQEPQLAASVARSASQPVARAPSQSAKPSSQEPMTQLPAAQEAEAWVKRQVLPQEPQFWTSPSMAVSQASSGRALQSPQPGSQAPGAQAPSAHRGEAWAKVQVVPQLPQLSGSVAVDISHPLASTPSQSAKPSEQKATMQPPRMQAGIALSSSQMLPQPPQLCTSVMV